MAQEHTKNPVKNELKRTAQLGREDKRGIDSPVAQTFQPAAYLPAWAWEMRVTNWPVRQLAIDKNQIERRAAALRQAGVNAVVMFWLCDGRDYRHVIFDSSVFGPPGYEEVFAHLRAVVEVCHKNNIRVIEHHGVAFIHAKVPGFGAIDIQKVNYKHWPMKNWLMQHLSTGKPTLGDYNAYSFCPNNPDYREAALDYLCDVMDCGVDGVMPDDTMFMPDESYCGCLHCRQRFQDQTGFVLPTTSETLDRFFRNLQDPAYRAWIGFRQQSVGDFHAYLAQALYKRFGQLPYFTCSSTIMSPLGYVRVGLDDQQISRGANVVHFELCNWNYHFYNWLVDAAEAKVKQAVARQWNIPNLALFYPKNYLDADFNWALARTWQHNCWLNWDRWSWQADATSAVELHCPQPGMEIEHHVEALRSMKGQDLQASSSDKACHPPHVLADVAVLYSRQSANAAGMNADVYEHEWLGWTEALINANIQLDILLDEQLQPDILERYPLLIVPNALALSDDQVACISDYVRGGGNVFVTAQTAMFDATGSPRSAFAFEWMKNGTLPHMTASRCATELAEPVGTTPSEPKVHAHGKGRFYFLEQAIGRKVVIKRVGARSSGTVRKNYPPHLSADWRDHDLAQWMGNWVDEQLGDDRRLRIDSVKPVHVMAYQTDGHLDIYLVNVQKAYLPPSQTVTHYQPSFVAYESDTPVRMMIRSTHPPKHVRIYDTTGQAVDCPFSHDGDHLDITLPSWSGVLCYCRVEYRKVDGVFANDPQRVSEN